MEENIWKQEILFNCSVFSFHTQFSSLLNHCRCQMPNKDIHGRRQLVETMIMRVEGHFRVWAHYEDKSWLLNGKWTMSTNTGRIRLKYPMSIFVTLCDKFQWLPPLPHPLLRSHNGPTAKAVSRFRTPRLEGAITRQRLEVLRRVIL